MWFIHRVLDLGLEITSSLSITLGRGGLQHYSIHQCISIPALKIIIIKTPAREVKLFVRVPIRGVRSLLSRTLNLRKKVP